MSFQAWYAEGYEPQRLQGGREGGAGEVCRLRAKGEQRLPVASGTEPGWKRQGDKSPLLTLDDHGSIHLMWTLTHFLLCVQNRTRL